MEIAAIFGQRSDNSGTKKNSVLFAGNGIEQCARG